jgi:hypothetical protein
MFDTVSCIAFFCIFRVVTVLRIIFLDGWNVIDLFVYLMVYYALAVFPHFFVVLLNQTPNPKCLGRFQNEQ